MAELSILMPAPERIASLVKARGREFAWGTAENDSYLWNGNVLGRVGAARLGPWVERLPLGYADRIPEWKTLTICADAQGRYRRHLLGPPSTESLDLEPVLLEILRVQKDRVVWAERDADQEPLLFAAMRPSEIVSEVRRLMLVDRGARPFVAWPKEESDL